MAGTVFIVGAGFSLAANRQLSQANHGYAKRYPLASDLGKECFGDSWVESEEVERQFDLAVSTGNREPIRKLVELIQTADYYLGWPEAKDQQSVYGQLIDRFADAHFLSFNYDSLLEQVLLHRGLWNPVDGFGVKVEAAGDEPAAPSRTLVLHLHGSVLLYPVEFSWSRRAADSNMLWMNLLKEPRFRFDPDTLGNCFSPFVRTAPNLGYKYPEERVIVPVPDKSKALLTPYVRKVYRRACSLLAEASQVIAIGYHFAECDRCSFDRLLGVIIKNRKPLCVVGPTAKDIIAALRQSYPGLNTSGVELTFEAWSESSFQIPAGCAA